MTDTIRKRHEARARYDAWLVDWQALDAARHCRACHDIGLINNGSLPCPYCRPDEATREATP